MIFALFPASKVYTRISFECSISFIHCSDNGKLLLQCNKSKSHKVSYLYLAVDSHTIWIISLLHHSIQPKQWNFTSADVQVRFMWHRQWVIVVISRVFHINYLIQLWRYECNEPYLRPQRQNTSLINCGAQFFPRSNQTAKIARFTLITILAFNITTAILWTGWLHSRTKILRNLMEVSYSESNYHAMPCAISHVFTFFGAYFIHWIFGQLNLKLDSKAVKLRLLFSFMIVEIKQFSHSPCSNSKEMVFNRCLIVLRVTCQCL